MRINTGFEDCLPFEFTCEIGPPYRIVENIQDGVTDDSWYEGTGLPCQDTQDHAGKKYMRQDRGCPAFGEMDQQECERRKYNRHFLSVSFFERHLHIASKPCSSQIPATIELIMMMAQATQAGMLSSILYSSVSLATGTSMILNVNTNDA